VDLLLAALDEPNVTIQDGALAALLERRTVRGHREIIARLSTMDARRREIVRGNPRFLGRALREAIQSADSIQCTIGCDTALWLREYELMPALVHEAENKANPNQQLAARHVLELAELLYQDLALPPRNAGGRDPKLTRQHVLHSLERSLARFGLHKRSEIVEAFLLLAPRDQASLKRILSEPMHDAYMTVVDELTHSTRGGIIRLALSFLDDPLAPAAAIAILGQRHDSKFLEHFLQKIGSRPVSAITNNLRRIDAIGWLNAEPNLLNSFDDETQSGAVQLALLSGIPRSMAYTLIAHLVRFGKPSARRAATQALGGFRGTEANQLVVQAANDADPQVQAIALAQLRSRSIPGALATLLAKLDSPHEIVRSAVRGSLDEFSFDRFQAAFDMLDDQVRTNTGAVVRKVDLRACQRLKEELQARSRTRRLRGVAMATAMNLAGELESCLIERLSDEDHLVRAEAARALAGCSSPAVRAALQTALHDRSIVVQEAAEWSLEQRSVGSLVSEAFAAALAAEEDDRQLQTADEYLDSNLLIEHGLTGGHPGKAV
jgi:HEAT repeat protein